MSAGALQGVKVVEFAGLAPAPFAAMMLADHGAEVLRIERPGQASDARELLARSREIVELDLKDDHDRQVAWEQVCAADVLLEGFRPGVMERLGLGPAECLKANPGLVYGRMTGWGQDGPLAHSAGHDINYIALSGALGAFGPAGVPPVAPVNLVGDFGGGGLMLAFGVLAALVERHRSGRGQVVDAAMIDGASVLTTHVHQLRQQGVSTGERGTNLLDGGAPFYRVYRTADGRHVAVGAIEPPFYAALLRGLELDPATLPAQEDQSRWAELAAIFAERFALHDRDHWAAVFAGTDACVAEVLDPTEVAGHPHAAARRTMVEIAGSLQPAPAPRFDRTPAPEPRPQARVPKADLGEVRSA